MSKSIIGTVALKCLSIGYVCVSALISGKTAIRKYGIIGYFRYVFAYVLYRLKQCFWKGRFEHYGSPCNESPLSTYGEVYHPDDWATELPQDCKHLEKLNADETIFHATEHANGETFFLRFARYHNQTAEIQLIYVDKNGVLYETPELHHLDLTTDRIYHAGGLRMECIAPHRIWRLLYIGNLRRVHDSVLVQAKLTLLWHVLTKPLDFQRGAVANQIAMEYSYTDDNIFSLISGWNAYSAGGTISGLIKIDDDSTRTYLWGYRFKVLDSFKSICQEESHYFGETKDGFIFHVVNKPCIFNRLKFGWLIQGNGKMFSINSLEDSLTKINKSSGGITLKMSTDCPGNEHQTVTFTKDCKIICDQNGLLLQKHEMTTDEESGIAYVIQFKRVIPPTVERIDKIRRIVGIDENSSITKSDLPLCVSLNDPICKQDTLTGGKAASLAILRSISKHKKRFHVPRGVVLTTEAYKIFASEIQDCITELELKTRTCKANEIMELCKRATEKICSRRQLPRNVYKSLSESLLRAFNLKSIWELEQKQFAVRSSAVGEDSQDMSAAGQMETFLGVQGLDKISEAVIKCWASQFYHIAVQYKRRYALPVNSDMAVVIQELVPASIAGVMFTCDPVSCNTNKILITANYGLGESVVSAAADPDTIVVARSEGNNLEITERRCGTKTVKIIATDHGTKTETVDEPLKELCISDGQALALAQVGIQLESFYGCVRDIEWAFSDDKLYLLQSRPISSIGRYSDYELIHMFDTGLRSENERFTRANVGEVIPLPLSPLGNQINTIFFDQKAMELVGHRQGVEFDSYYYVSQHLIVSASSVFMSLTNGFANASKDANAVEKAMSYAVFVRELNDPKLARLIKKRKHPVTWYNRLHQIWCLITDVLFIQRVLKKSEDIVFGAEPKYSHCSKSRDAMIEIFNDFSKWIIPGHYCLIATSISSALLNQVIMAVLSNAKGSLGADVFSCFSKLVTTTAKTSVESADVPAKIKSLSNTIAINRKDFAQLEPEQALSYLQTGTDKACHEFRQFIDKHGHRCIMEYDIASTPWRDDPISVVKTLQGIVKSLKNENSYQPNKPQDSGLGLENLPIKLSWRQRKLLEFVVPRARKAVGWREHGKSILVRSIDNSRRGVRQLAKMMKNEGLLPDEDLIFYLTPDEIYRMTGPGRCPHLVSMAIDRKRVQSVMQKFKYSFFGSGIPTPLSVEESSIVYTGDSVQGTPVSEGKITAAVRVVAALDEASNIQEGEILVTEGTDTGWTPYFPLLSGVITELGGLLSHGAVVAREYGMPCVVGIDNAIRIFRTGDIIELNGTTGLIRFITKQQQNTVNNSN